VRVLFQSKSFAIFKKKIKQLRLGLAVLFVALFVAFFSQKIMAYSLIDDSIEESAPTEKTFEQQFLDSNTAISRWLVSFTDGIDLFLVGPQLKSARNDTRATIQNSTFTTQNGSPGNQTAISFSPRLPNLEQYWNLKFTSYDDQTDNRASENNLARQAPRETNYGATIGLFKSIGKVRAKFQPRIELQNPLKISHSLAFETVLSNDNFQINPKLDFFVNATTGAGVFQALNFNFKLIETVSLTLINEGTYEEKTYKYSATNGFSLGKSISETDALAYSLLFFSNNNAQYHLESYSTSISWYHLIYKKILDLQLSTHLSFGREWNFIGQAGLSLQLTLHY